VTDMTTEGIKTVLHTVTDLERAKRVFTVLLGAPPTADSPYYVGYDVAGQHIGLVPAGPEGGKPPVSYWHVPDIDATRAGVIAAGATGAHAPAEVGPGRRVATVIDPDGNVLGLLQDG
jgi:predicted enzyme related to lactoylglutathione lyase